jgi:hypothetical protein
MVEIKQAKIYRLYGDEKDKFFRLTSMTFTMDPVGVLKEISTFGQPDQGGNKPEGILYHNKGEGNYRELMIIPLPESDLEKFMEDNFEPKK